ncbi:MAG: hypothetical protein EOR35_06055 [Mesorhizobium sp.]|nr:MAG: hypothetical protein EOR35_06055 [Mesorhizobium sp.]
MPFGIFYRVLLLVLYTYAPILYFVSHSIRTTIVTTLVCAVLLQVAYFGSVVFLIWRSGCRKFTRRRNQCLGTNKH